MASYTLSPVGGAAAQFFDNNGNPLSGGKLYTYAAGTTTPQSTWTTPAGATLNTNPIVLDSAGRPPQEIWLSVAYSYKFVLKTSAEVLIATYDNIPSLPQPAVVNDASSISYEPGSVVNAGSFIVGNTYMIATLGDTNFVSIGAAYNSTGQVFTATGVGTGTGTAYVTQTVQGALRNENGYVSAGTSAVATIAVSNADIQTGNWFNVYMSQNSNYGMTLNGKAVKVLDIYATEESQWTITSSSVAAKDKPKVDVYRTICQNMLSADVEYQFRYVAALDIYEVFVLFVYKHVFIPCGNGKEITELQNAMHFASQFRIASYMDPIYMNVTAATEYYPLKGQISVAIASGTTASPVTSVMTKAVRIGENNLNGVEIVNEKRYTNTMDTGGCIVQFNLTLGTDDLACLNIWKTDLGEIRGITFKFAGAFTITNQAVIGYWNTTSRLKQCVVDVTGATVGVGITAYAVSCNSSGETNQITIACPAVLTTGLFAIWTGHSISALTVTGVPETIIKYNDDVTIYGLTATNGASTYAVFSDMAGSIKFNSGSLSAVNLFATFSRPLSITFPSAGFTLTLTNINNKWVNKVDNFGNFVIYPALGRTTQAWGTPNNKTVLAADTSISVKDGQLNILNIAAGAATIDTVNLDIGAYTFAATGERHAIEVILLKSGAGTVTLTSTGGNITTASGGGTLALANSEPVTLLYESIADKWLVLR